MAMPSCLRDHRKMMEKAAQCILKEGDVQRRRENKVINIRKVNGFATVIIIIIIMFLNGGLLIL